MALVRANRGTAGQLWLTMFFAAGSGLAAAFDPTLGAILMALVLWVGLSVLAPTKLLVFVWALTLPIWSIGQINPLVFDAARLALALSIAFRLPSNGNRKASMIAVTIGLLGLFLTVIGVLRSDSLGLTFGYTMVISAVTVWMVMSRVEDLGSIISGYSVGVFLSASVLVMSSFGWKALTPLEDPGFSRLTGLSSSATLVSYELAIGVLIGITHLGSSRRAWYVVAGVMCTAALLLCGGRGGLVGLVLAIAVALRWKWLKFWPTVSALGLILAGFLVFGNGGSSFNTLARFMTPSQDNLTDLTTGRTGLLDASIQAALQHPLAGVGLSQFVSENLLTPHVAVLTFYVAGGVLPGLVTLGYFLIMSHRMFFVRPHDEGHLGKVSHLILGVLVAEILLEPTGPFVGTQAVTFLVIALGAVRIIAAPESPTVPAATSGSVGVPVAAGPSTLQH